MAMRDETDVLILGAGPNGLALAAKLKLHGIDHVVAGQAMSFWRDHMPAGMLLRSGLDWHLDVGGEATLEAFAAETAPGENVLPLSRDRYLDYVEWFSRRKQLAVDSYHVDSLDMLSDGRFVASGAEGSITARAVVIATGFRDFAHVPAEMTALLPPGVHGHTCEVVDFERFRRRRVLVVGGRQSAFESAALIAEAGARSVDVVYRHPTPEFVASDWSWVQPLMQRTQAEPGWYRALPDPEREALNARFWAEGRLKLEPWLAPRIAGPNVHVWPGDEIVSAAGRGDTVVDVGLKSGATIKADYVLFATGYKVDVLRLPFLASSELSEHLEVVNGFPVLDTALQSSVPGLYFTSIAATQDFGPFFAFTVSARCSAELIGNAVSAGLRDT